MMVRATRLPRIVMATKYVDLSRSYDMSGNPEFTVRATPETFRARSVVVSLTADDLRESLAWYTDVVGFIVGERFEDNGTLRGVSLKAGGIELMLSQDDGALGEGRAKGQGLRIYFDTAQDVDQVADAIRTRGGTLASEPQTMPWGARAFSLVDPSGFKLTISSDA
jgi:uncharacterized glyoxalase superfamily protein PhnB